MTATPKSQSPSRRAARRAGAAGAAFAAVALAAPAAHAHGIWGHIHVTGWAITNLPAGEVRDFFNDSEVFNAALFGAAYTDSGYWPQSGELERKSREYSEHSHWEPFIQDFVTWIIENDPPPWDTLESKKRVAFLIGVASHGLQDEVFDSLFLEQVENNDGGGQDVADPGTDGFMAIDEHIRFVPTPYYPLDTLLELYEGLNEEITADVIERSVGIMTRLYVGPAGFAIAESLGNSYSEDIPWTRDHYLDPDIPGSLRAEIGPTRAYIQAVWDRLHGTFDASHPIVAAYPESGRVLRSGNAGSIDATVTFIFGEGVHYDSARTSWRDQGGEVLPSRQQNTRWGAEFPRLLRVRPLDDLEPGGSYSVTLESGTTISDGVVSPSSYDVSVTCGDADGCEDPTPPEGFSMELPGPEPAPVEPDPTDAVDDAAEATDSGDHADGDAGGGDDVAVSEDGGDARSDSDDAGHTAHDGASADAGVTDEGSGVEGDASSRNGEASGCATATATAPVAWPSALSLIMLGAATRRRRSSAR